VRKRGEEGTWYRNQQLNHYHESFGGKKCFTKVYGKKGRKKLSTRAHRGDK